MCKGFELQSQCMIHHLSGRSKVGTTLNESRLVSLSGRVKSWKRSAICNFVLASLVNAIFKCEHNKTLKALGWSFHLLLLKDGDEVCTNHNWASPGHSLQRLSLVSVE